MYFTAYCQGGNILVYLNSQIFVLYNANYYIPFITNNRYKVFHLIM